MAGERSPVHFSILLTTTFGVGFIVIVKFLTTFEHPLKEPVTVMVATMGLEVELVANKLVIFPVPALPIGNNGLLFVHEKVVPT